MHIFFNEKVSIYLTNYIFNKHTAKKEFLTKHFCLEILNQDTFT